MADAITIKALQDASLDAKSLEEVVNGNESKQVTTRKGETYPSVKKAIKTLFENGGLPATPFATKALMTASTLVDGQYAMVTDDTVNNGLYVKTAGAWVKSNYDPIAATKDYTDALLGDGQGVAGIYPVVVDINNFSPLWVQNGSLNFADIHPSAAQKIADKINIAPVEPVDPVEIVKTNNTSGASYPIISDGATLNKWKTKLARLKVGGTDRVTLALTGDSWTDYANIPEKLSAIIELDYQRPATGWINAGWSNKHVDGISTVTTGAWVEFDISDADTTPFPLGGSPDGFTLKSTTVGDKWTVSGISKGESLTIFYGKTVGALSYSLNDGALVAITPDMAGTDVQSTTLALTAGADKIELSNTSGEIVIFGLHARTTGGVVEVNKMGNGSSTADDFSKVMPLSMPNFNTYLDIDVVIVILGTNDKIKGLSTASYEAGLNDIIDGYRSSNPFCGVILVAPAARTAGMERFRDAVYKVAKEKGTEFYNMTDDWTLEPHSRWLDGAHVNDTGGYLLAKKIYKNLLEI